jgi:hypothetical protein
VGAYSPSRGTSNNGDVFDVPEEAHGNKREVEAIVCFPETEADKCAQYLGALPWIDKPCSRDGHLVPGSAEQKLDVSTYYEKQRKSSNKKEDAKPIQAFQLAHF